MNTVPTEAGIDAEVHAVVGALGQVPVTAANQCHSRFIEARGSQRMDSGMSAIDTWVYSTQAKSCAERAVKATTAASARMAVNCMVNVLKVITADRA